jgi:hypothetical protein
VLAARLHPEITHLTAAVFDEPVTEREFQRMRFVENQLRSDLSNAEKAVNCLEYAKSEPSMTLKEIAADLNCDPGMVTRWMSWGRVIPEVQQALAADKITLTAMYSISQLPKEAQAVALDKALAAPNEAAAVRAVKQRAAPTVRLGKVKIPLATDAANGVVTVAGEALDWDDAEAILKEALRAVRAAKDKGLDYRTAQAMWRDMAKA